MSRNRNAFFDNGLWHFLKWRKRSCSSCACNKWGGWSNRFYSNVCSKFFYFVAKVSNEKTGKVNTRAMVANILGGYLFERISTTWCSFLLEVDRDTLCLPLQVFENNYLRVPPFFFPWHFSLFALKSSSLIDSNHGGKLWFFYFLHRSMVYDNLG